MDAFIYPFEAYLVSCVMFVHIRHSDTSRVEQMGVLIWRDQWFTYDVLLRQLFVNMECHVWYRFI